VLANPDPHSPALSQVSHLCLLPVHSFSPNDTGTAFLAGSPSPPINSLPVPSWLCAGITDFMVVWPSPDLSASSSCVLFRISPIENKLFSRIVVCHIPVPLPFDPLSALPSDCCKPVAPSSSEKVTYSPFLKGNAATNPQIRVNTPPSGCASPKLMCSFSKFSPRVYPPPPF